MARKKRNEDLKNRGWSINDFGPFTNPYSETLIPTNPDTLQGVVAGTQRQSLPQNPNNALPQNYVATGVNALQPRQLAAGTVDPNTQEQIQTYIQDPDSFVNQRVTETNNVFDKAKNVSAQFLSNVFNIEDEKENILETSWDGMLAAVGWGYDRINQVTTAGISGLPGGIDTLTWDQAGEISVGQALVTNAAQFRNQLAELGPAGEAIAPAFSSPTEAIGQIASLLSGEGFDPNPMYARKTFDLTDPLQREAAFSKSTTGKWASGTADLVFSTFADPLILGGKFLKIARIKYVDKPIVTQEQMKGLQFQLSSDVAKMASGDTQNLSSVGTFLKWVTSPNPETGKKRTLGEIARHPVVKDASHTDALVAALYDANDFEEASLVMRVAYGDLDAKAEILTKRADLAVSLGQAQKEALALKLAINPAGRKNLISTYSKNVDRAKSVVRRLETDQRARFGAGLADNPTLAQARADLQRAEEQLDIATSGRIPNIIANPATKDEMALADAAIAQMEKQDMYLQRLLQSDVAYSLQQATKGFGGDSVVGRMVEKSRERRATAAWESASTQGRGLWRSDDFYKTSKAIRMFRVWRWFGQETPEGYIATKGTSAIDSGREIVAQLNSVKLYSGVGKSVTIDGKPVIVGGIDAKNRLLEQYYAAVGSSVGDQTIMQKALMNIEEQVMRDIGAFYGMEKDKVTEIVKTFNQQRSKLMDDIRNRGYWVDVSEKGEATVNKTPYLESQLQNGMYLMDFKRAESVALEHFGSPAAQRVRQATDYAGAKLGGGYQFFNELWRPMVLLRLGYTQRNVTEGLFRSSAFLMSLAPLANAAKQVGFGIENPIRRKRVQAEVAEIDALLQGKSTATTLAGTKFGKWRETQLKATVDRIAKEEEWADNQIDFLKTATASRDELDSVWKDLRAHQRYIDDLRSTKELLMNDKSAVSLYWKQAGAKRRVKDGYIDDPDNQVWKNAFNNESGYTPIALMNLSADLTTRQMLAVKMNATETMFRAERMRRFVSVTPEQGDEYFDGVAEALTQFKSSEVGNLVLSGANERQVAKFLMQTDEGRQIVRFLNDVEDGENIKTLKDAEQYALKVIQRLETIAPNPELVMFARGTVGRGGKDVGIITGADAKRFLDNDQYRPALQPVIGNVTEYLGATKSLREGWASVVNRGFRVLGTIPEDALVRAPFYGKRYEQSIQTIRRNLLARYGDDQSIPWSEVDAASRAAHARALKDTRKWLYTIERRTNLGAYGEHVIPFISATQNSITTLGRLTWKDPSIIGMAALVWNAPDNAGWVDDEGNVRVSLPLEVLPKGLREVTGLDAMKDVRFSKSQFNVVFPETGFMGFVPRPGPIVGVLSSELMKNGFLGFYGPEAPPILTAMFGEKQGDEFWEYYKSYIYGEEGGLSANTLSWDKVTPPWLTKILQMGAGLGSSKEYARWYNGIYRSELLKYQAGLRDDVPDASEVTLKTNMFHMVRVLANLTAFTPPSYDLKVQPILDAVRKMEQDDPENGSWKAYELFGETLATIGDFSVTKNVAGGFPSPDAVRNARKYGGLIQKVSGRIGENLDVLGIILNEDPNYYFDESAYAWQFDTLIPGQNKTYRELQSPEQALLQSQKSAGWTKYLRAVEYLDSLLEQRGAKSYRQAPDLQAAKDAIVESMRQDPLYTGWYEDYKDFGSQRAQNTVTLLEEALADEGFVDDHVGNPVWIAAQRYVEARREIIAIVDASGSSIDAQENARVQAAWDAFREDLKAKYNGWGVIANRYLSGDDDPKGVSQSFESQERMSDGS